MARKGGRSPADGRARDSVPGPQDRAFDRRAFLHHMAAVSAAAAAGGLGGAPGPLLAAGASTLPPPRSLPDIDVQAVATDPVDLTLAEAAALIRQGGLSPAELLDAYLERIGRFDEVLRAFNVVLADQARAAARGLEGAATGGSEVTAPPGVDGEGARQPGRASAQGLLLGVPLAIKDNYYTAGVPTTANSLIFRDFVPGFDATVVARLRAAGGIVVGKTQMGPLATTRATTPEGENTTVNAWAPFDPSLSPGGSSSGSATAVAARLAASSIGTQTGGSITVPALAQGLTGLKPTMGRVSLYGVIPLTYTRDHPGPIARDAVDASLMLQAMAGPDPNDPRTLGLPPVPDYVVAAEPVARGGRPALRWPTTIGLVPGYAQAREEEWEPAFPDPPGAQDAEPRDPARRQRLREERRTRAEAEAAARREMLATFEALGARVVEVPLPDDWDVLAGQHFNNVRLPERSEPFLEHLRRDVRLFGVSLSPWINGLLLSGDEYLKGQRAKLLLLRRILDDLFARCDVVVQTRPFPFDIVGLPLIAFPIGMERTPGGERPIGAMLGGLPFGEERLLSLAAAYQAVTDWHLRRPPDPVPMTTPGEQDGDAGARGVGAGTRGRQDAPERGRIDALEVMELTE